jgi:mono/diheme cytochrome c family protein
MESIASTWRIARKASVLASGALTVALALSGCGNDRTPAGGASVAGVVAVDAPASGTVTLKDSSVPPKELTTAIDAEGRFTFDGTGLTPPFVLRAEASDPAGAHVLYSVGDEDGDVDVNAFTDAAVRGGSDDDASCDDAFERGDAGEHQRMSARFGAVAAQLGTALQPLLDRYGVPAAPFATEAGRAAVRALLADVQLEVEQGTLVVTNRATGAVIFSGPLRDLASGTFHPENLPAGGTTTTPPPTGGSTGGTGGSTGGAGGSTGTTPPPSCTYTYSAWGACQNGSQARTVTSSAPAGCTGIPVLAQSCTATPPPAAIDGAALYTQKCSGCHGSLATSSKRGRTAAQITAANMTQGLSAAEVQAVATALGGATGTTPPPACTFTYSAWGTCQSGSQARTVTSSAPASCVGAPVLTQACTVAPPPPPAIDGAALYQQKCSSCHGPLATSTRRGRTAAQITAAGMTMGLSPAEVQAVAAALAQ